MSDTKASGSAQPDGREGAPVTLMSALAVRIAMDRWITSHFEATSGLPLQVIWGPTSVLVQRIADGERADVIIAVDDAVDELARQGILRPGSIRRIVQTAVGVAVKAGAPWPDISTVAALCESLTSARAVAYSRGGASGIYFADLIRRLGIAEAVNARAVIIPAGFTAEKLVSGEAELAIQQISELMAVPGVDIVGALPAELQPTTDFSAAIFSEAAHPEGAEQLMAALISSTAHAAYRDGGGLSRLSPAGA